MATKIIDTTYRFCGKWQDTHEAHLFFGGYLCPGTEGSSASTVAELVTALEALDYDAVLPYLRHAQECRFVVNFPARCSCGLNAILFALGNARDLLARLKGG